MGHRKHLMGMSKEDQNVIASLMLAENLKVTFRPSLTDVAFNMDAVIPSEGTRF
ncbi:hypothetical protein BIW11_03470 [Tropilaelaps mercedesae]|uniref:Uncharacterized protein n=1 Tax=Tropilaelaps mercedesae TaxID=418985 RepID=A0A1V9XL32_9ACAR|nr:hypothetical protein BIW11_03470 [Tropilaelaps mercedesae]